MYSKTKTMGKFILYFIGFGIIAIIISFILNMASDTSKVVQNEFSASAMLKKYEHFKNLGSSIQKKRADIEMYREELSSYDIKDKDDKFYYEQRKAEAIGIISIHNQLVAEYNSGMSKFNYRFANVGELPQSNLESLPKEYQSFETRLLIKKQ